MLRASVFVCVHACVGEMQRKVENICFHKPHKDPVKRPSVTELLFTTSKLCASLQSRVSASFSANEVSRLELSFSIRPMRKGEEVEAASVLAR